MLHRPRDKLTESRRNDGDFSGVNYTVFHQDKYTLNNAQRRLI